MNTLLQFDSFFAYSESKNKYFYNKFHPTINIIHGPNTSGKSTFFQLLLYTIGINDNNEQLSDILKEDIIFRLDCTITQNNESRSLIFIRENDLLIIKHPTMPPLRLNGISSNNSAEHIKLKDILHKIFKFNLYLESKGEYKPAPIEAMFLPFYIAQSVGWVYLRKSFSALDFYRNLKEDYLDYFLGITNYSDRLEKQRLEREKEFNNQKIYFLEKLEEDDSSIKITKLTDESFIEESKKYIQEFAETHSNVADNEKKYIFQCNKLSHLSARRSILSKIKRNTEKQAPEIDNCPSCHQRLPISLESTYNHLQSINDTNSETLKIKVEIKKLQGEINSLHKNIDRNKAKIASNYEVLEKTSIQDISFKSWIKHKATARIANQISKNLDFLKAQQNEINKKLASYQASENIIGERTKKEEAFKKIFIKNLISLNVAPLNDGRYLDLYKISAFPTQGVELHKTVMAYHFAINEIFSQTKNTHRFPFILDAIFKEDIDPKNKKDIISFVFKNHPIDTQLFVSMALLKDSDIPENNYDKLPPESFKTIIIGDGQNKRSLLKSYKGEMANFLHDTMELVNSY